jgi:hypothetical protein
MRATNTNQGRLFTKGSSSGFQVLEVLSGAGKHAIFTASPRIGAAANNQVY